MGRDTQEVLSVGNTVIVTSSHYEESSGADLQGWSGIIRQIFTDEEAQLPQEIFVLIEWDFSKVSNEKLHHILKCYQLDQEWSTSVLPLACLRRSEAPFSVLLNEWAKNTIGNEYFWNDFPEHCELIRSVFPQNNTDQSRSPYSFWEQALVQELNYPVHAHVIYPYENDEGDLQLNEGVKISGIAGWDLPLGVFVQVERRNRSYILPLQDIEPTGSDSQNAWIEAYQIWLECRA